MTSALRLPSLFGFLFLIAVFGLTACSGDDDADTGSDIRDPTRLTLASGIVVTDEVGQPLQTLGSPNNFGALTAFPNPAIGTLNLFAGSTPPLDVIEIVPASKSESYLEVDMDAVFVDFPGYSSTQLEQVSVQRVSLGDGALTASIDLSGLDAGYYRFVAIKEDGQQSAATVYVDPSASDINALRQNVIADWP